MKVDNSEVKEKSSYRSFRMGERIYISREEIGFPIELKTDSGDYIKREVKAYMIDADRVNFLLGKETMKEWKLKIDQEEDILVFKGKKVRLSTNREENLIAYLEMVGKWEDKDEIDLVEKEDEVKNDDKINSVIQQENDKGKIQEKVSEILDILEVGNLDIAKFIEDMSREVLVYKGNIENGI